MRVLVFSLIFSILFAFPFNLTLAHESGSLSALQEKTLINNEINSYLSLNQLSNGAITMGGGQRITAWIVPYSACFQERSIKNVKLYIC